MARPPRPRSAADEVRGSRHERWGGLVVLPRASHTELCPVTALRAWLDLAEIRDGPVFRAVGKNNRPSPRRLSAGAVNDLIQQAIRRSSIDRAGERDWSAYIASVRAGFGLAHHFGAVPGHRDTPVNRAAHSATRPRP